MPTSKIHPLFPTLDEVKDKPDLAYSDHLPLLMNVPVSGSEGLNLLTYNTLGQSADSGLHKENERLHSIW